MNRKTDFNEREIIDIWTRILPRSPIQINEPFEADAEIVKAPGSEVTRVAVTIDTISEEISLGLYRHPFTIGWVAVMASLSDLAAVGAQPLGIVVSVSVDAGRDTLFCEEMARGMAAACNTLGVYVLGGDTNSAERLSISVCSVGLCQSGKLMTRKDCAIDDILYVSGRVGQGSALAVSQLEHRLQRAYDEVFYRPVARIRESDFLREYTSCCMDTSDGLLRTLYEISTINDVGIILDQSLETCVDAEALTIAKLLKIPVWMMMAGPHGEFELVFTIPPDRENQFNTESGKIGWYPIRIGRIVPGRGVRLRTRGCYLRFDVSAIVDTVSSFDGSITRILESLGRCAITYEGAAS